uniref:Nuclear receptor domain-containing protein n=1 Tax=Panagrolaimus sp. JU765 TaxID=591449 RepID=A0AC34Q152_9BILA
MSNFDSNYMDSKMDVKIENSPTPSSEYTTSEDEDASRESYGVSSIRIFDNDSQMNNGLTNQQYSNATTNFSQLQNNVNNLSSSLPSTSGADTTNSDPLITNANIQGQNGRKRTFSTSESQPTNDRRTATKICRVCGDKAYSYNFNVISCESCKAFFRRNANKEKEIRCPFNDQCDINIVSRRFCQRCRLQKCFRVGMKKEWIMSEEARLEKKQRILDNRERRAAERQQEIKKNSAEELAAAIVGQPIVNVNQQPTQQQQQQASTVAQVAAALLPGTVTFNTPTAAVLPTLAAAAAAGGPTQNPEVVQLAAAVAQVAAAHVQPQTFPTQNDPGQMATERALIASIAANSTVPQQTNNTSFVQNQQQIVNQLAVAHAAQVQIEQQLQQQAVVAAQVAQVQAAAQIVQQHQQQQLVAAVAAAAASTMVPNVTQPSNVVTVPITAATNNVTVPSTVQIPSNDMVAIPRDVLFKLVEQRLEVEQPQQLTGQPPKKCQCHCTCGRYPNELLIVDKVMTDLLETSTRYNHSIPLSQLSPKNDQSTTSTNILSTSPPQNSFINHGLHQQMSNVMFQPMCTGVGPLQSANLPLNIEDDYVFKSIRTAAC